MSNMEKTNQNSSKGVFIDIDGVLLQGGKPFPWSKEAIKELHENDVSFAFVTNGTYSSANLIQILEGILELPINKNQIVVAPSPCLALTEYHDKHMLVCGQRDSIELIDELGFKSYVTVEQLAETFPLLDYVDHDKRKTCVEASLSEEVMRKQKEFKPIEAILLIGEPVNWERSLQVLIDILMTNGDPRTKFNACPNPHLPIIACNKDLTFKGAAALPRFGNGSFLMCLESLYKAITKNDLEYKQFMGKPLLITYEFAAKQIQNLRPNGQITHFSIIGDNPEVDIVGANNFKHHLLSADSDKFRGQIVKDLKEGTKFSVESILVCTGVYNPKNDLKEHLRRLGDPDYVNSDRGRRRNSDYTNYFEKDLSSPDLTLQNLKDAVQHIINFKV